MSSKEKDKVENIPLKDWSSELKTDFEHIKKRMNEKLEEFTISRLNPTHFYSLQVEYEGNLVSLSEIALVNLEKARLLTIKPYLPSQKITHDIEKAIKKAKPNLTINIKDNELRCSIPEPTQEIREEKIKSGKQIVEEAKIALRNKRKDLQKYFKNSVQSENQKHSHREQLDKEISKYVLELEDNWAKKEKELRTL
ncbi:ribosome-recycling factor [Mycoplasma suis]|uniref:Ribosome recycling factor n=1 Tax=Mycoplasma suis (strain Illinois) TaxID=768700 RepID=F0QRB7_MYCSL|nr:ribosome-recycling factor [Mycoplasma suis]ADX98037.1 ribosome recycling factor [Mycoplasma suis str. Illinois]